MSQYKVPQDVEAEDKLIGPLSLRQFIYVVIGLAWAGLMWLLLNKVIILMAVLILPVTGFFLLLGFGRRPEQSFESYFVALVKFFIEPRIRVWDKDLTQEQLVRHEEKPVDLTPTKTLNRGSLKQLAMIMDTHGTQKDPSIQLHDEANTAVSYGNRVITPEQVAGNEDIASSTHATVNDDVLEATNTRNVQVNELLENAEAKIHTGAISAIKHNLIQPQKPTAKQGPLAPQTSNAIINRAIYQGNNLTVAQIANQTSVNAQPEHQAAQPALKG